MLIVACTEYYNSPSATGQCDDDDNDDDEDGLLVVGGLYQSSFGHNHVFELVP